MNGGKRKAESRKQKAIKANDQSGIRSFALVIRFNSFLLSALRFLQPAQQQVREQT